MTVQFFQGRHNLDRRAVALIDAANEGSDDELLDTPRTAVWLGVSPEWLEIGRSKGWGPPFIKLSPRRIRYRRGNVKQWLAERAHRATAEYADKWRHGRKAGSRVEGGVGRGGRGGHLVRPDEPDDAA